jgi:hypothetical protein
LIAWANTAQSLGFAHGPTVSWLALELSIWLILSFDMVMRYPTQIDFQLPLCMIHDGSKLVSPLLSWRFTGCTCARGVANRRRGLSTDGLYYHVRCVFTFCPETNGVRGRAYYRGCGMPLLAKYICYLLLPKFCLLMRYFSSPLSLYWLLLLCMLFSDAF